MEKIPEMGDDAFGDGFLNKKFGNRIIKRLNRKLVVVNPNNGGTAKFLQDDEQIVLDLSGLRFTATAETSYPLKVVDASNAEDGLQVRVYYGTVGGVVPDGMSEGDVPPCFVAISSTTGVYAQVTLSYTEASNLWTVTDVELILSASTPSATSTVGHVLLASVAVSGGAITGVAPNVTGSQVFYRRGTSEDYTDYYRRV